LIRHVAFLYKQFPCRQHFEGDKRHSLSQLFFLQNAEPRGN
jgi:hypothetical protein